MQALRETLRVFSRRTTPHLAVGKFQQSVRRGGKNEMKKRWISFELAKMGVKKGGHLGKKGKVGGTGAGLRTRETHWEMRGAPEGRK